MKKIKNHLSAIWAIRSGAIVKLIAILTLCFSASTKTFASCDITQLKRGCVKVFESTFNRNGQWVTGNVLQFWFVSECDVAGGSNISVQLINGGQSYVLTHQYGTPMSPGNPNQIGFYTLTMPEFIVGGIGCFSNPDYGMFAQLVNETGNINCEAADDFTVYWTLGGTDGTFQLDCCPTPPEPGNEPAPYVDGCIVTNEEGKTLKITAPDWIGGLYDKTQPNNCPGGSNWTMYLYIYNSGNWSGSGLAPYCMAQLPSPSLEWEYYYDISAYNLPTGCIEYLVFSQPHLLYSFPSSYIHTACECEPCDEAHFKLELYSHMPGTASIVPYNFPNPNDPNASFTFNYGDGPGSVGVNSAFSYQYTVDGSYTACYTVATPLEKCEQCIDICIPKFEEQGESPLEPCDAAAFKFELYSNMPGTASIVPYNFPDPNDPSTSFIFDYGDGPGSIGTNAAFSYQYTTIGNYTACYSIVTDETICKQCIDICITEVEKERRGKPGQQFPILGGVQDKGQILDMSLYPNPTNTNTTLDIDLKESASINIKVIDIAGHLVKNYSEIKGQKGKQKIELQTGDLNSGNYFIRIEAGKDVIVNKLTVIK